MVERYQLPEEDGSVSYYDKIYFRKLERTYPFFSLFRDRMIFCFIKRFIPPGGKILEVGCGTGNFLKILARGYKAFGLDVSPFAVRIAKRKSKEIKVFVGNISTPLSELPFSGLVFDGIVGINLLEHLGEPERALGNICRLLREKGYLFLHLPTQNNIFSKFFLRCFFRDPTHVFIPRVDELKGLLGKFGFSLVFDAPATLLLFFLKSEVLIRSLPIYFAIFQRGLDRQRC